MRPNGWMYVSTPAGHQPRAQKGVARLLSCTPKTGFGPKAPTWSSPGNPFNCLDRQANALPKTTDFMGMGESLHFQVTQIWMLMWLVLWQEGCGTFWGFQFREPPDKSCAPRILQLTFAPDFGFTKIQRADLPSGLAHASEARLQQAPVCILWKGQ